MAQTPIAIPYTQNTDFSRQADNVAGETGFSDEVAGPNSTDYSESESANNESYDEYIARVHGLPSIPKGFFAAFHASFGGITGYIVRAAMEKDASNKTDPSWNVDTYREEFRSSSSMNYWNAFEETKNKSDYDLLVIQSIEAERRSASIDSSFTGTLFGWLFDPVIIFMLLFIYKGLKIHSYLSTISPTTIFWGARKSSRLVALLTALWILAVLLYVFLFDPYGDSMYSDDYIHMLKVIFLPTALVWIGYAAYPKLVTPKPLE